MPHHSQITVKKNMDLVRQEIAKTMPNGAKNKELIAMLMAKHGFEPTTSKKYLLNLQLAERIVWDSNNSLWKLPSA